MFCGFDGGDHISHLKGVDIFIGGAGGDSVHTNTGTFYGGNGNDSVDTNFNGDFNGGVGVDYIDKMISGTFDGGDDTDDDYVVDYIGGRLVNVP